MIERCGGRGSFGYLLAFGLGMLVAKAMKNRQYRAMWRWRSHEGAEGFHHGPWCHGPWCEGHHGHGAPQPPPAAGGQAPPTGGGQPPEGSGQ